MNFLLRGLESKLRNNPTITQAVRVDDIQVVSEIDSVPPGVGWPYIIIKDAGIDSRDLHGFQKEEFLNAKIYLVHRIHQAPVAAQLLDESQGIIPLAKYIVDLLEDDWNHQFALVGHYLGKVPIQILKIHSPFESEPFTPKGEAGSASKITSRLRIDCRYYRYSTRQVGVAV